jgi:D-glycero-D-manno-heptose 1,7-bisphosphate phosphatase
MLCIISIPLITLAVSTTFVTSVSPEMPPIKTPSTTRATPKLVLVDRDGVINEDVGAPGVLDASRLELTTGAGFALGCLRRAGYKVVLITNQSCVGKGLITESDLCFIHTRLQEMLLEEDKDARFDQIFACMSLKKSNDHRMKPNPGMIEEAMKLFGGDDAVASTFDSLMFVGDTLSDMEAAARAGVPTRILVETGYGRGIMGGKAPDVDGTVEIVDEKQRSSDSLTTTMKCDNDDISKPSIFPFLYAKNFCSAVQWILTNMTLS